MPTKPSAELAPAALAERLKLATAMLHRRVERSTFMASLLRDQVRHVAYVGLLRNLQAIYGALERALARHAAHRAIAPLVLPTLFRSEALAADLALLDGAPGQLRTPLCDATRQYVERLDWLDSNAPELLVAHAYVRYLGDLNGGQVLRRMVARGLGLQGDAGTRFYEFGDELHRQCLTRAFRDGLQVAGALAAQPDAIVNEAVSAFERHAALFDELGKL